MSTGENDGSAVRYEYMYRIHVRYFKGSAGVAASSLANKTGNVSRVALVYGNLLRTYQVMATRWPPSPSVPQSLSPTPGFTRIIDTAASVLPHSYLMSRCNRVPHAAPFPTSNQ